MGLFHSKPLVDEDNRAYSKFLERFKNTHSYLCKNEADQYAVMTWNMMSARQKSQFLNIEETARAYIRQEYLPITPSITGRSVAIGKQKTKAKSKPKPKPKPKLKATTTKVQKLQKTNKIKQAKKHFKGKAE